MGSRILFVAGPSDQDVLSDYIRSLGLHLLPLKRGQEYSDDPRVLCGCWISPVTEEKLNLTRKPPCHYSDVLDPILRYTRCVYTKSESMRVESIWDGLSFSMSKKQTKARRPAPVKTNPCFDVTSFFTADIGRALKSLPNIKHEFCSC